MKNLSILNKSNLYHGTLLSNASSILKHGLQPRGSAPSHDEYLARPSLPEFVYLARSAWMAASHAVRISEEVHGGAAVTILEVPFANLSKRLLYPDEDWIADERDRDFPRYTLREQMRCMWLHKREWCESLFGLQTVAYRGVVRGMRIWEPASPPFLSSTEVIELIRYEYLNDLAEMEAQTSSQ